MLSMILPGLQEESDHTAWLPTSLSKPAFSSFVTSRSALAVTFVPIVLQVKRFYSDPADNHINY